MLVPRGSGLAGVGAVAFALLFFTAIGLTGCASRRAPGGWLPGASKSAETAYGGWIKLRFSGDGFEANTVSGELLGLSRGQVFVLTADSVAAVPMHRIAKADVEYYDPATWRLSLWTLTGTLSTISHGVGLIISAPVWIIGGSAATASHSRSGRMKYPDREVSLRQIAAFARFPQGIPPELDLGTLREMSQALPDSADVPGDAGSGANGARTP